MSVPEGKRGKCEYKLFTDAHSLTLYTIKICCNPKVFLPQFQNALTNDIISCSKDIYLDLWNAKNINVVNFETYKERYLLQRKAYQNCNNLLALMQIAGSLFHLKNKRIKYWGEKTLTVRNQITEWHALDDDKYKQFKI